MTPEQEKILLDYLAEGKVERITVKDHMRANTTALQRIFHQLELHEQKDDARHTEVKSALAGLNARVDALEDAAEDTARHNVEELQQELRRREGQGFEWKKFLAAAVVTIGVALASGTVSVLVTLAMKK